MGMRQLSKPMLPVSALSIREQVGLSGADDGAVGEGAGGVDIVGPVRLLGDGGIVGLRAVRRG